MSDSRNIKVKFADRLREIRESRKMTQAGLGHKASITRYEINHYEADKTRPSFKKICSLAQALNVTIDYLMGFVSETPTGFLNAEKLSETERDCIQSLINIIISPKK